MNSKSAASDRRRPDRVQAILIAVALLAFGISATSVAAGTPVLAAVPDHLPPAGPSGGASPANPSAESPLRAAAKDCPLTDLRGLSGSVRLDEPWDAECDLTSASGATVREVRFSLDEWSYVRMELYSLDRVSIRLEPADGGEALSPDAGDVLAGGPNVPRDHTMAWRQDVLAPGSYRLELASHAPGEPGRFILRLRAQAVGPPPLKFTEIGVGYLRSCGILEGGTPLCWGLEARGAELAADLGPLTQIKVGSYGQACGLTGEGRAVCWGGGYVRHIDPEPGRRFSQIDLGRHHLCGVQDDQKGNCWFVDDHPWRDVPKAAMSQISVSDQFACALRPDGSPICWGHVDYGQTDTLAEEKFVDIRTGERHVCGLRADSTLACWGSGGRQECHPLEDGLLSCFFGGSGGAPLPPEGEPLAKLSSGEPHCGLRPDGLPVCWTQFASLGLVPPPARPLEAISATATLACGLDKGGAAVCWGDDRFGQASPPAGINATGEVTWPTLGNVSQVSVGAAYACAIDGEGQLSCWGPNWWNGRFPRDREYAAVSSSANHACALDVSGAVICRGEDGAGQSSPPSGLVLDSVSVGYGLSCGLRPDGSAVCWGSDYGGGADPPEDVRFRSIDVGSYHACGITREGRSVCWGEDAGRHGLRAGDSHSVPTQVSTAGANTCYLLDSGALRCTGTSEFDWDKPPAGTDFAQVSRGGYVACGLRRSGSVTCWGAWFVDPINPPEGEVFTSVSAGSRTACGVTREANVLCWGDTSPGLQTPLRYVSPH